MTTKLVDTMKEALAKKQNKLAPENKKSGSTKDSIKSQTSSNRPMKKAAGRGG
jgi:hypothetical protein